jgi:adenine-specific DNA-methyltransferase
MYPRLQLARNLLTDDGVIFISIDDNEVTNLKKISDEVFGEENFISSLAVQLNPRGRNLDKYIAKTHESVLVYLKNSFEDTTMIGLEKEGKMVEEYNRDDKDGKGAYRLIGLRNRNQAFNPITRPKLYFPLFVNTTDGSVSISKDDNHTLEILPETTEGIKTCWTWGKSKVENEKHLLIAEKSGEGWRIHRKDYLIRENGETTRTLPKSIWLDKEINNDYGKQEIKNLFGKNVMSFPKSPYLVKKLIQFSTFTDSIILDFFSGSATTAHAVMQLNAEDGGNRKFIMVQLPEETDPKSEAYKAGYKNICEIGKERIRRAGKKIEEELNAKSKEGELFKEEEYRTPDTGFRVLKVDSTNMKDVYYSPSEYNQQMLLDLESNIKEDRTDIDLLYGVLLDWGVPLSLPHITEKIGGKDVHFVNDADLVACFEEHVPEEVIREIARRKPLRVVFRDSSFRNSPDKINVTEIFKTLSPETTIKVI